MANLMMKGVKFRPGCEAGELTIGSYSVPILRAEEVMIRVVSTAVNRADILQRKGGYPPPPGESEILGLEAAGIIEQVDVNLDESACTMNVGDRVMALLPGGGNAEFVAARMDHLMRISSNVSWSEAAAIPEVWLTAYQLLNRVAQISMGERVLIHAGASGVGTAAVQLVTKVHQGVAFATAGSQEKCQFLNDLGAQHVINYKEEDFADEIEKLTRGKGVDIVLDCIGGSYWERNVRSLCVGGRWVLYGLLGGGEINGSFLNQILRKRIRLEATTLRARSAEYKSSLVADFSCDILPRIESGVLKPIVDTVFPFEKISEAHKRLEENKNIGKVVLLVKDSSQ